MGTINILHLVSNAGETGSSSGTVLTKQPSRAFLRSRPGLIRPKQFARVRITGSAGLDVHALLNSVSRSGIQVMTPREVPIRCPLEITLAGCRPFEGEAFYCIKRSTVFKAGIVFSSTQKPNVVPGTVATAYCLEAPIVECRGSILDVAGSTASILCKTPFASGSRVRLESNGWVLFGVVRDVIPTSMIGRRMEVHLEAAFPAQQDDPELATVAISSVSCALPNVLEVADLERQAEGVEL
jgi:hypothetical protein